MNRQIADQLNDLVNRVLNYCEKVHKFSNEAIQAQRNKQLISMKNCVCVHVVRFVFENVNLLNLDNEGSFVSFMIFRSQRNDTEFGIEIVRKRIKFDHSFEILAIRLS